MAGADLKSTKNPFIKQEFARSSDSPLGNYLMELGNTQGVHSSIESTGDSHSSTLVAAPVRPIEEVRANIEELKSQVNLFSGSVEDLLSPPVQTNDQSGTIQDKSFKLARALGKL